MKARPVRVSNNGLETWARQGQPRELATPGLRRYSEGNRILDFQESNSCPSKNREPAQSHQRLQDSHGTTRKTRVKRIFGKIGENFLFGIFDQGKPPKGSPPPPAAARRKHEKTLGFTRFFPEGALHRPLLCRGSN